MSAVLKFHPAESFFGAGLLKAARACGDVSAAVCARIAFGDEPRLSADGDPLDGEMVHLTRDTAHGAVLRSRFLLGAADGCGEAVPEQLGLELMRHCYNEFSCLARLLPSLYYGEHANGEPYRWPGRLFAGGRTSSCATSFTRPSPRCHRRVVRWRLIHVACN